MQNHKTLIIYFLLSLFIFSFSCNGQIKETQADSRSTDEIVSAFPNEIWSIFQDQQGKYWFGSNGQGVFVYDGISLKKYTREDGLVDNSIRGIQGDKLGNVYIQTPNGISKYDGFFFHYFNTNCFFFKHMEINS